MAEGDTEITQVSSVLCTTVRSCRAGMRSATARSCRAGMHSATPEGLLRPVLHLRPARPRKGTSVNLRPRWPAQEDSWEVISAFFQEKSLVRQQLDSFNEFVNSSMQEIVDENKDIIVRPRSQVCVPLGRAWFEGRPLPGCAARTRMLRICQAHCLTGSAPVGAAVHCQAQQTRVMRTEHGRCRARSTCQSGRTAPARAARSTTSSSSQIYLSKPTTQRRKRRDAEPVPQGGPPAQPARAKHIACRSSGRLQEDMLAAPLHEACSMHRSACSHQPAARTSVSRQHCSRQQPTCRPDTACMPCRPARM